MSDDKVKTIEEALSATDKEHGEELKQAEVQVIDDVEEEDCFKENLDNCCGENARGLHDCACCLKQCTCEIWTGCRHVDCRGCMKKTFNLESVKNKFPILKWLPKYRLNHFLGDVIAGLTVGLTIIPQSLAFAKIALLPPQYGMYTAAFCVYMYIIFGTAKDVNLGPAAVLSLLVSKFAKSPIEGDPTYAIVLCLMCGIVQFVMGVFHLGFIVNYVSYPVLESFTTAAVITIAFGQVRNWLGLEEVPNEFLPQVYWTFAKIPETRIWDFVLGLICMIVLVLMKKMKLLSCMKKSSTSIPVKIFKYIIWLFSTAKNAVVVMLAIVTAYLFHLNGSEPFTLTGEIPAGLPPFKPPAFMVSDGNSTYYASDIFQTMGIGVILVPLISFIETMAIAKNFARKNNYKVDKDQELIASGAANLLGSFLSAYPVTGTFSGSAVNFQSGVKTTGSGIYAGTLVVMALLFLTPVFYYIPTATLAAVIIVAVLDLTEFGLVIKLWNVSKIELIPWFVTFILGLCIGIENGILLGIIVALCILIYPASKPKVRVEPMGSKFSLTSFDLRSNYAVLLIDHGLMYPSTEYFVEHVQKCTLEGGSCPYKSVILNFVHISSVDFSIIQSLEELSADFSVLRVSLVFCKVRPSVQKILQKSNIKNLTIVKDVEAAIIVVKEAALSEGYEEIDLKHAAPFVVSSNAFDEGICSLDMENNNIHLAEKLKELMSDQNKDDPSDLENDDNDDDDSEAFENGIDNFSYAF